MNVYAEKKKILVDPERRVHQVRRLTCVTQGRRELNLSRVRFRLGGYKYKHFESQ
jgi:hypothetical protein